MNLPNTITIFRLILVPVFLILWWKEFYLSSTLLFFVACVTDLLDGYLARRSNQETKLGALLDPLVDKVLITAGLVLLVELQIVFGWAVVLMLTREFLVTGLRTILIDKGILLSAGFLGKLKTFLQSAAITFLILGLSLEQHKNALYPEMMVFGNAVFWLAFVITILSGVEYAWRGKRMLDAIDKNDSNNQNENHHKVGMSNSSQRKENEVV